MMRKLRFITFIAIFSILASGSGIAQTRRQTSLSNVDISRGLREALSVGIKNAVAELGRENGFLDNADVRIPLPNGLKRTESTLRFLGQGKRVDEFVAAMNHAAEKAVPVAVDIFLDSAKQMTFNDARNILFSGQDDAATQFFRRTSEDRLRQKFRPIVEEFTVQVGVTQKYKEMIGRYSFVGRMIGEDASDIDGYVTEKAMDGLFFLIAEEEKKIRRDPIGRTTAILRTVFGVLR
ncbi:DUF4197 domain-containing protein [Leptolyngbya sp. 7M]|uniref:DUF4197 domain-containing protein n=1 Tax=Leptolyngbya sp. 7M TaxID=2812896 RepID=UPI001B8CC78D|nr:DUF4197 domain-containing protein [Leptolyngbya sp. 7M]QYO61921.1 DUF4197 domain-containing protein [Leptolyngbya sp. 7M]